MAFLASSIETFSLQTLSCDIHVTSTFKDNILILLSSKYRVEKISVIYNFFRCPAKIKSNSCIAKLKVLKKGTATAIAVHEF